MQRTLDKLVTDNLGYVVSVAKQYCGRGVDLEDLISEGNMALVEAAPKYDPSLGVTFVRYAAGHIRRAMERAIESQAGLYRVPRNEASRDEKKRKMPLSVDEPRPLGSKTSFTLLSIIENKDASTGEMAMETEEAQTALKHKLASLDERERRVLTLLYGLYAEQSHTMAEAGQVMGLKRERVRQIRDKALRKMRRFSVLRA